MIIDLAAEAGGNCELTEPGKDLVKHGVTILGPLNVVSAMAYQASQLYSRNVLNFLLHIFDKQRGAIAVDRDDEITRGATITHAGGVVHEATAKALGIEPAPVPRNAPETATEPPEPAAANPPGAQGASG